MLQVKLGDSLPVAVKLVLGMKNDLTWDVMFNLLELLEQVVPSGASIATGVQNSNIIKSEPVDVNYVQSNSQSSNKNKCLSKLYFLDLKAEKK